MGRIFKVVFILQLAVLFLTGQRALASIDNFPGQKSFPFTNNTSLFVLQDDKFTDPMFYSIAYRSVKDAVSLRVRDGVYIGYAFDYYVNLSLECYNSPSQTTPTILTQTLQISYNNTQGLTYRGVSTYNFSGYYKVNVKITGSGPVTTGGPTPGTGMVELTGNITVDRLLPFSPSVDIPLSASALTTSSNQLILNWTPVSGAEEYDLEWTTLDKGDPNENIVQALIANNNPTLVAQAGTLFRNNASRTTTSVEKDTLSLSFNDDYLVMRIRQVQYATDGTRTLGAWCYKMGTGYAAWDISQNWHSPALNWQYSAAYAEDGKKKEVVSYFDGSLRNRQTVTLSNSYKVPIVQESVYDSFGRPATSILPAPVKVTGDPYLHYFPSLNVSNVTTKPYNYTDIIGTGGSACEINPNALSTTSGSSRYYSSSNDFLTDPKNKYIPDAEGFPLLVTQYMADNTGRVSIQGGVGLAFQPGKTAPSHTTKYIYGKPDQWELDQLFGNDVGYAQHYSKNTVIDPNNQISVSYLNASGKTIATALAGAPPAGMDSLVSKTPEKFRTSRIIQPEDFVFDNNSMKFKATTTYVVTVTGPDTIKVNAEQLIYTFSQSGVNICSNCYFDLKVTVANACNQTAPVVDTIKVGKYATTGTANGGFLRSIPMNFTNLGEYYVTAELVMSKSVMESYVATFITQGQLQGVVFKEWHFVRPYLDKIDFAGILSDCSTAAQTLGTQTDFSAMFKAKLTSLGVDLTLLSTAETTEFNTWLTTKYTALYSAATANCNLSPCNDIQNTMLQDLRPGGQYALFDQNKAPMEASTNVISQNWRTAFPVLASSDTTYINHKFTRADGSISSANDASATLNDIVTYWHNDWALYFLQYHPEYCKLQFCMTNSSSYDWDAHVKQLTIAAVGDVANVPGAPVGTTYSYTNAAWLLSIDPFFKTAPGANYLTAMQNDLNNYSQAVLGYTQSTKSLSQYIDYFLYCSGNCKGTDTQSNNCWDNCSATTCRIPYRDWDSYKTYYLQLKDKYYKQARNATTCGSGGSCPIGQPYVVPNPANSCASVYDFTITPTSEADLAIAGVCDSTRKSLTITYQKGKVSTSTYVFLYTSPEFAIGVATSITFAPNTTKQFFCVPKNMPISSVQIKAVNCTGQVPAAYNNMPDYIPPYVAYNVIQRRTPGPFTFNYTGDPTFHIDTSYIYMDPVSNTRGDLFFLSVPPAYRSHSYAKIAYFWTNGTGEPSYYFAARMDTVAWKATVFIPDLYGNLGYGTAIGPDVPGNNLPLYTSTNCTENYLYKTSRFDFASQTNSYPADTATAIAQNNAELAKQIQSGCEGNADRWMALLDPGIKGMAMPPTQATIDALRAALIKFCADNGDKTHPYGASTFRGTGTNLDAPYTSFGDIIKSKLGISAFTDKLNPWLFDGPNPYAVPLQANTVIISSSNAQIAARITQFQADYVAAGSPGTFYSYLSGKYGGASMAQTPAGDLTILQNASAACNYVLAKNITLPVFMQPGATGYITGSTFDTALSSLTSQISGVASSPNYNVILANFMNQRFGFSLSYSAWADFAASHTSTTILTNQPPFQDVATDPYAPVKNQIAVSVANGKHEYDVYIIDQQNTFRSNYITTCVGTKASVDNTAQSQNYHYTLYYYDQADNLIRTIPPEGVTLLTDAQIAQVQLIRGGGDGAVCGTAYTGPTANAVNSTAFTNLGTTLSSGQNGAIELWLYNTNNTGNQLSKTSTDGQYLFQLNIKANTLGIDIYSQPSFGTWGKVNRVTVNTSTASALQAWTHVVVQSNNFLTGEMIVYVNGFKAPVVNNAVPVVYPENLTTLKHMRLYNRLLLPEEVQNNATDNCFMPTNTDGYWGRFNIPVAGTETTVSPTSTKETKLAGIYPVHLLPTSYTYNATNQVVMQYTPDGGYNRFWYDMLSRLVASQNDKQQVGKNFSYTTYDALGRTNEVGQKNSPNPGFGDPDYLDSLTVANFIAQTNNIQITHTYYDAITAGVTGLQTTLPQLNLRKRAAASSYRDTQAGAVLQATYYNYDLAGNVSTLWQQVNGLGTKQISYEYDLASGKVNFVRYQDGQIDKFYYKYKYDADNRIVQAFTGTMATTNNFSGSDLLPENARLDASYYYYLHGPLARIELGDLNGKVQGLDYAYTLQGWFKGVNNQGTVLTTDIGQDGITGALHQTIARDAFAYSLGYYKDATASFNDFRSAGGTGSTAFALQYNSSTADKAGQNLWNGNISNSTVSIGQFNSGAPVGYTYHYDQLNRLKTYIQHQGISGATWDATSRSEDYKEIVTYDGNGNILTYRRNGTLSGTSPTAQIIDELKYNYNRDINGRLKNNRLAYIQDTVATGTSGYANDINTQTSSNYGYDVMGNSIKDTQANITNTDWNIYGKITTLYKSTGNIVFTYDAFGNRVSKKTGTGATNYYVRDAQGNTLATYSFDGTTTVWKEQDLYGSSRLGLWTPNLNVGVGNTSDPDKEYGFIGRKYYELDNHLGNVLATITDRRLQVTGNSTPLFIPDVNSAQDYYPFGMLQPGRQYIAGGGSYRYGFNGKENDDDVKGAGNQQDYGERIYDPRVGRFLSMDPITRDVPGLTPYQFGGNSPIAYVDLDGLEQAKPKGQKDFLTFFIHGVQDGLSEQTDEAKFALIKILSNPETYHKLDEIADQAMRNPVKLIKNIDKSVSKAARRMAFQALKDAVKVGAAFLEDENKGSYEAGKFVAKYGVFLLAPEEEGIVYTEEGISIESEMKAMAESTKSLKVLRREGVAAAWKEERELVLETGQGTRRWTKAEIEELKTRGKIKGYHGHHINSVNGSPDLASDPNNIEFVKGAKENLERHGGNFRNPTRGPLINRKEKIKTFKGSASN
jgi:RHS repeat-associated protein